MSLTTNNLLELEKGSYSLSEFNNPQHRLNSAALSHVAIAAAVRGRQQ